MTSIRRHLTLWLLLGTGALVAVCGLGCYLLVERTLYDEFDRTLTDKAAALGSQIELELEGVDFTFSEEVNPEYSATSGTEFFQLWTDGVTFARRSPSLGHTAGLPRRAGPPGRAETFDLPLPDGRPGRAVGVRFPLRLEAGVRDVARELGLPERAEVTLVCARGTGELESRLAGLVRDLVAAGAVLAAGVFLLVRFVVASGCRPLDVFGRRIDDLEPDRLPATPLDVPCPEELEPVRKGFERFTRRIAQSLEREKRVTSNIAHEMRTPVAELMTVTELARMWPDDEELKRKTLRDAHEIAVQMDRLVRACLRMARLQSGQAPAESRLVDASRLLEDLCTQHGATAAARGILVERHVPAGQALTSDPEILELILGNLFDNALHHAPEGTWVRVRLTGDEERMAFLFANPVEDVAEDDLANVSEPFWRKEPARTEGRHLGLGLAMVTSAAETIGAEVRFALRDGAFEVVLTLPRDPVARLPSRAPGGPVSRRRS